MTLGPAILSAALCVVPTYGWAQASPSEINDCTLLTDPTEMQYCIYVGQGLLPALPPIITSNGEYPFPFIIDGRRRHFRSASVPNSSSTGVSRVRVRLGLAESTKIPQQESYDSARSADPYHVYVRQVDMSPEFGTKFSQYLRKEVYTSQIGAQIRK
jgi:hypothetical protein